MLFSAASSRLVGIVFLSCTMLGCATARLNKKDQQRISNKVIVITGASSGFGRGVAERLGAYKASVVLAARRTELLDEIAARIRASGGKALVVTTDVSKPTDLQHLADAALKELGHIDVWINNAGIAAIGSFWDVPVADHLRVIDVNLNGIFNGSYIAISIFRKQGYGKLINTGSVESEIPTVYQTSYSASKAAVRSLGQALYQELRLAGLHKKISVVTVLPWAADTPVFGHAANYSGGTPRMPFVEPPYKVINAIIFACLHRKKELPVGAKARIAGMAHHIFPFIIEPLAANIVHRLQVKTAPPAPDTTGTLYTPMQSGRGIEDGVKERIKKENRERKQKKRERKRSFPEKDNKK